MKRKLNKLFLLFFLAATPIAFFISCKDTQISSQDSSTNPNNTQYDNFDPNKPTQAKDNSRQFRFAINKTKTYNEFKKIFFDDLQYIVDHNERFKITLANPDQKLSGDQLLKIANNEAIQRTIVDNLIELKHIIQVIKRNDVEEPWKTLQSLEKTGLQTYQHWVINFDDIKKQVQIQASFGHYHSSAPHITNVFSLVIDDFKN
ncbi:hypothetical protein [Mesomycoplasma hyorhinis]|uniref:Lipoprotein n=2 Tax=Mesomycoplasma hyorhinis TaxID=2100 RepID=A0ABD6IE05_MESHY|nr:hypothetical protein [Mesomycoplasma hyorhinis]AEC46218.1 hypothetical protein SRH_03390 [Mesomycoplasma hyorhinis MCLD]AEX14273.1 putative lipoprotein [Mesomycoplasma hyorhinis GDL-1]AHA41279.1 hypothetical protein Q453_0561 [Mesomycoplasma hyorhinis DBS 1050]AOD25514.1 putative lipoprotein [Mesomycoplasma hyorhinis]MXR07290.1 hypothetical protein [Mesomycoplasma hyorhinis]